MKISKFARQNYILLALSIIFALIANAGVNDVATNGVMGFGMMFIFIGGLASFGFVSALVFRIWDAE